MPAYVPPALRGVTGQQTEGQPKLGERVWRIKVEYSTGGPFDAAECPETLIVAVEADQTPEVAVRHFDLPFDASTAELKDLLDWFSKASSVTSEQYPHGDARCQMLFPTSLSKDTRKLIHQMAQGMHLPTFSKGLGEDRRLAVHGSGFKDTPEMEAEVAAVVARRRAPGNIRDRAKQIWRWCQADGGALWSLSQGEMEEALLAAPDESALPASVKDLLERREHGAALMGAIKAGDAAAALAVLEAHPRAAWIRDEGPVAPGGHGGPDQGPGYYPLHLAALAGLGEVVESISGQSGTVEQRDRNYATPLKVAKKAGQAAMVEILLRHGAKDYDITQAAHKTAAMGIPQPSGPTRRISSSHGGSPHVGSPATASSPHASSGSSYMASHAVGRQRRLSGDVTGHRGPQQQQQQHQQHPQHQQQHPHQHPHQQQHPHQHHGPSGLGSGHRASGSGRRSLDEQHPPSHPHAAAAATAANDPTANPFAVLAGTDRSGASSRRSSAGGLPPRAPGNDAAGGAGAAAGAGASDSDSSTGGAAGGGGYGSRGGARARLTATRCALPPIQSGEVSEQTVAAALAGMGLSAPPGLPTAAEAPETMEEGGAGGAGGSDDDDANSADGPKKRKTRRGRRGRGNRRTSSATADDSTPAVAVPEAAGGGGAAAAAAGPGAATSAPVGASGAHLLKAFMANRSEGGASAGGGDGDSSDHSGSDGSDSDGSGGGSRTRRGGQPARARRHERRRAARVSGADGSDRPTERGRRGSGAEYSSFHHGAHGVHPGRGVGGEQRHSSGGGHYHVHGSSVHHGHADDAGSWRRDPAAAATGRAPSPAPAAPPGMAGMSPMRGGPDEPRLPAAGRPPAPRRMSAGPGLPVPSAGGVSSAGGALPEAPGSPFHHTGVHGPREHVAAGPAVGMGFGFGRGRGRGLAPGVGGVPSAPGSPMRPIGTSNGPAPPPAVGSLGPAAAAAGSAASAASAAAHVTAALTDLTPAAHAD